jgi:UDP-GlcNAc3NAcA epimerase
MRIVTVVGARPQFVKAAIVSSALRRYGIEEILIHTGQHYDESLSGQFFRELGMCPPAHNLAIGSGPHGEQTGRMMQALEPLLIAEEPDWLLVYGDTNSTLAGALAAAKLHIPIAHVEAGLRSFNRKMPEEINRVLTDHVADRLFAPTEAAVKNLSAEGLNGCKVQLVGDVMYDAALEYRGTGEAQGGVLEKIGVRAHGYVLATVHRAENTDDGERLAAIFGGLCAVADELPVVAPLHPRTHAALGRAGLLDRVLTKLHVIEPVGYGEMLTLESSAAVVATDSGGVQKEAYFQRVPCVTLRDETEWVELVETGWNRLCSPTTAEIVAKAVLGARGQTGDEGDLYGGGHASVRIAASLAGELP